MTRKRILIIGGYGLAGTRIVHLLLKATSSSIIVAGRNLDKATEMAEKRNRELSGNRVRGAYVDASDVGCVKKALQTCDLVVSCVPVSAGANVGIVRAAADTRVDYVNLEMGSGERTELETLSRSINESGSHFLINAGIFPGTPSMLIRLAASNFGLKSVTVGMIGCATQGSIETAKELISAGIKSPYVYRDGDWCKVSMTASEKIDFGRIFSIFRGHCNVAALSAGCSSPSARYPGERATRCDGNLGYIPQLFEKILLGYLLAGERAIRATWMKSRTCRKNSVFGR